MSSLGDAVILIRAVELAQSYRAASALGPVLADSAPDVPEALQRSRRVHFIPKQRLRAQRDFK